MFSEILISVLFIGIFAFALKVTGIKLFREVLIYIVPFAFGLCVKKYAKIEKIITHPVVSTVCLIVWFLLFPFYSAQEKTAISLVSRFVAGLCFTSAIWNFAVRTDFSSGIFKMKIFVFLKEFGKSSIAIYAMHELFRPLFADSFGNAFFDTLLRMISAFLICTLIVIIKLGILKSAPLLSFLLFGTKNKQKLEVFPCTSSL